MAAASSALAYTENPSPDRMRGPSFHVTLPTRKSLQERPDISRPGDAGHAGSGPTVPPPHHRSHFLRRLLLGWPLRIAISAGLIALLAYNLNWDEVAQSVATADTPYLVAALIALAVTPALVAERWRAAGLASGIRLSRGFFFRATYAAVFAGQFLPAGVGVDAARFALLWHQKVLLRSAAQSLLIDRLAGVAGILFLMVAGMPFAIPLLPQPAVLPVAGLAALLIAGCAFILLLDRLPLPRRLRTGRPGHLLHLVAETRAAFGSRQAVVALLYGISIHGVLILSILWVARAFGYTLQYQQMLTVVSFAIFAALLPISVNGWGVREGAMVLGLSILAVNRDAALLISFVFGVASALVTLPGSLSWHRLKPPR